MFKTGWWRRCFYNKFPFLKEGGGVTCIGNFGVKFSMLSSKKLQYSWKSL